MQSGKARTKDWVLEHKQTSARKPDPLMGWSSADTTNQVRLSFETKEEAIAYAERLLRMSTRFRLPESLNQNSRLTLITFHTLETAVGHIN